MIAVAAKPAVALREGELAPWWRVRLLSQRGWAGHRCRWGVYQDEPVPTRGHLARSVHRARCGCEARCEVAVYSAVPTRRIA
jgi:hypothetical protein